MSVHSSCYTGHLSEALQALRLSSHTMEWVSLDIYFLALQRCIESRDLVSVREIHCLLVSSGYDSDAFIVCHLIRTYAMLEALFEAMKVFIKASKPTAFSWGAIISGYANLGQAHQAFKLFGQMEVSDVEPDGHVFFAVLKSCIAMSALKEGETIYAHIIAHGLDADVFAGSCLVDMYVKCSSLENATIIFQVLPRKNVTAWNALIAGYSNAGRDLLAMELFHEFQAGGHVPQHEHGQIDGQDVARPNAITYLLALRACSNLVMLGQGQFIHACIIENGIESDLPITNTLIDMYGKCGSIRDACVVFDMLPYCDVVSWSVLISSHTHQGYCAEALELFEQMRKGNIQPDHYTFVCVLKVCSMQDNLNLGKELHDQVVARGLESDLYIGSTLVDMYSKCESCSDARNVFDRLHNRGVVTWNAMISGYAQCGEAQEALNLFHLMRQGGVVLDQATYVSVLKVCACLAAFQTGVQVHAQAVEDGFDSDLFISTTLIDFYSQVGIVENACRIFNRILKRDVVSWNALIAACAQHNEYQLAFSSFEDMQHVGITPNHATLICILSACSHAGLVDEGCAHFKLMRDSYGTVPTLEHYDSVVDLFGHGGCLEEAEDLLETLPVKPNFTEWTSLLSSCRTQGNTSIAQRCFYHFISLDHGNAAGYVLMSNIYASKGMNKEAEEVEMLRKYANAWKKPGKAYIELDAHVHGFSVGSETHPRSKEIYAKLEELSIHMHEEGYKARVDLVLGTDEDREKSLCGHCEKLAIAFGLICTPTGTTLRVTKNLRVCADCHNATKLISKIERREIIISDTYRCHHFKDGDCSCKDQY